MQQRQQQQQCYAAVVYKHGNEAAGLASEKPQDVASSAPPHQQLCKHQQLHCSLAWGLVMGERHCTGASSGPSNAHCMSTMQQSYTGSWAAS
jgi:hypothetical protein